MLGALIFVGVGLCFILAGFVMPFEHLADTDNPFRVLHALLTAGFILLGTTISLGCLTRMANDPFFVQKLPLSKIQGPTYREAAIYFLKVTVIYYILIFAFGQLAY